MMKFHFVDFAVKSPALKGFVDKEFHNSTSSLLASYLRGRNAGYQKAFIWLCDAEPGTVNIVDDTCLIEERFPFSDYESYTSDEERLSGFARWLILAIIRHGNGLIDENETDILLDRLVEDHFTYVRLDKLTKRNNYSCTVMNTHTPYDVTSIVECAFRDKGRFYRRLERVFRRDEFSYGKAVNGVSLTEDGELLIRTYRGVL